MLPCGNERAAAFVYANDDNRLRRDEVVAAERQRDADVETVRIVCCHWRSLSKMNEARDLSGLDIDWKPRARCCGPEC
jgi:hypothetical protein